MAHIFLDANCLIDLIENRDLNLADKLAGHQISTSALSIHILCYIGKYHIPSPIVTQLTKLISVVGISSSSVKQSLKGPTPDFEDNIQLFSAQAVACDYFLTRDQALLKQKKWHILPVINPEQLEKCLRPL